MILPSLWLYLQKVIRYATSLSLIVITSCENPTECTSGGPIASEEVLSALTFIDASVGWVVSVGPNNATVYQTCDGGASWHPMLKNLMARGPQLFFLGPLNGWITLDSSIVLKTTNGGVSWKRSQVSTAPERVTGIFFKDKNNGWLTSYRIAGFQATGRIYETSDGGDTWTLNYSDEGGALISVYASGNGVWAVGGGVVDNFEPPIAIYSSDAGATFERSSIDFLQGQLTKVKFFDQANGVASGQGGCFVSSDSGKSWRRTLPSTVTDISLLGRSTVIVTGIGSSLYSSIIRESKNMGFDWTNQWETPQDSLRIFNLLGFVDEQLGWAAGRGYDSIGSSGEPILMRFQDSVWRELNISGVTNQYNQNKED